MKKIDAREAALILLRAVEERGDRRDKELSRARLSTLTLKRLWNREILSEVWLAEVNDWLLSAGWTLFRAGTAFGVVKRSIVENWPRISSKRIRDELERVAAGRYDFDALEHYFQTNPRQGSVSSRAVKGGNRQPRKNPRQYK